MVIIKKILCFVCRRTNSDSCSINTLKKGTVIFQKKGSICFEVIFYILIFIITSIIYSSQPSWAIWEGSAVENDEFNAVGTVPRGTGTIINNNLAITAAHNFCDSRDPENCPEEMEFWFFINNDMSKEVTGRVRIHPGFYLSFLTQNDKNYSVDLAVMQFDRPISEIDESIVPIPLAKSSKSVQLGDKLTVVGWGRSHPTCQDEWNGKRKMIISVNSFITAVNSQNEDLRVFFPKIAKTIPARGILVGQ